MTQTLGTQSNIGTGGFATKIQAVRRAALSGTYTVIASGHDDTILTNIFNKSYGHFLYQN
jgi:glutamate 5-kinase